MLVCLYLQGLIKMICMFNNAMQCRSETACVGGADGAQACAEGTTGPLCAICSEGFYLEGFACLPCKEGLDPGVLLLVLLCVVLLLLLAAFLFVLKLALAAGAGDGEDSDTAAAASFLHLHSSGQGRIGSIGAGGCEAPGLLLLSS